MFGTIFICALVGITTWLLAFRTGYYAGLIKAHKGHKRYLEVRIAAAKKGITRVDPRDYEQYVLEETTVQAPKFTKAFGTSDWFAYCVANFGGEAGEFQGHVAKAIRDDGWSYSRGTIALTPERRRHLLDELGDNLWYAVWLAKELDSSLHEVMLGNIEKIDSRHARGTINGAGDDR